LACRSAAAAVWMSVTAGVACLVVALAPALLGMAGACLDWSTLGVPPPDDAALVLPYVLRHALPPAVSMLGLVAIAAAVMSSVDSTILSSSSMFAWNVYRPFTSRHASDPRLYLVLRGGIIVLGTAAAIFALRVKSVYQLWFFSADLVYVVLFPQLVTALFLKRATAAGALAGAVVALLLRGGIGCILWGWMSFWPAFSAPAESMLARVPWRTLTMLTSLAVIALASALSQPGGRRAMREAAGDEVPRKED
jgi:high affinity choline transporter 7